MKKEYLKNTRKQDFEVLLYAVSNRDFWSIVSLRKIFLMLLSWFFFFLKIRIFKVNKFIDFFLNERLINDLKWLIIYIYIYIYIYI